MIPGSDEAIFLGGGRVVDPANKVDGVLDVLIKDGKIAAVGRDAKANGGKTVDVKGLVIAPGLVDLHVHLREPGQEGKETVATGTRAAVAGGVTSVCCMPNTIPALDSAAMVAYVLSKAAKDAVARVYPVGCISQDRKGEVMADMAGLKEAGVVAVTDDGDSVMNALLVRRAMMNAKALGLPYVEHAEDANLIDGGVMHEGIVSLRLGLAGRSALAEDVIVGRDLLLAEATGAHVHIAHISSQRSVEMVREAKKRGVRVTAEVTPHHLVLTDEAVGEYDTSVKVNPPIRSEDHRLALIEAVVDGTIDAIATDHAPHGPLDKDVEFNQAASGMLGLETLLPLVLEALVRTNKLSLAAALAKMTQAPAKLFGLPGGTLTVGAPADLVVFDPEKDWVLDPKQLQSKSKNTPFGGRKFKGKAVHTIAGGAFRVRDGAVLQPVTP